MKGAKLQPRHNGWACIRGVRGLRSEFTRDAVPQREASPAMKTIKFVGLDVHKESITISWVSQRGKKINECGKIPHCLKSSAKSFARLVRREISGCATRQGPPALDCADN